MSSLLVSRNWYGLEGSLWSCSRVVVTQLSIYLLLCFPPARSHLLSSNLQEKKIVPLFSWIFPERPSDDLFEEDGRAAKKVGFLVCKAPEANASPFIQFVVRIFISDGSISPCTQINSDSSKATILN